MHCESIIVYSISTLRINSHITKCDFQSILNITTRSCTDPQLRGGARAITRLGLIPTVWSPGARSENVTGEEPARVHIMCAFREMSIYINQFLHTSHTHYYWKLLLSWSAVVNILHILKMALKTKLQQE